MADTSDSGFAISIANEARDRALVELEAERGNSQKLNATWANRVAEEQARAEKAETERDNALNIVVKREAELEECLTEIVGLEGAVADIARDVANLQKLFGMVLSRERQR